ncbi:hypothetical protein [Campylobacter upsaliensis]|uniref:hypothetical protein n=1 Tax=Campylobacter upsaliensis TaxID=28080 RepID=UPI0022EA59C2|nr:hypothetical protein [Campylobacter upsaliensis]MEB2817744.1 hypothetical protein [Campylobacter upsaliensis]
MKKSLFIILFLFILGANSAFACLCAGQISSSYSDFRTHISTKLNEQLAHLKKLNASLVQTTATLSLQNELLKGHNALIKNDLLKEKKLIFELTKKNEMR